MEENQPMNASEKPDSISAEDAAKITGVQDENRDEANRTMPGRRAALPPGSLRREPPSPQSDENRDQPVAHDGGLTTPSKPPSGK
jgi:hypothetical protein